MCAVVGPWFHCNHGDMMGQLECCHGWLNISRLARQGSGVFLYVREQPECMDLCQGISNEKVESLWVRIKGTQMWMTSL